MRRLLSLCIAALAVASSPAAAQTLGEALNATNLVWTSGGTTPWPAQSTNTHDGLLAAQSGAITHSQETWVETTVTGPGPLSFWWSVSSEANFDYLEFYVNGARSNRISGTVAWQQKNYTLGAGTQVLRWRYMKDGTASSGQDRGWLDQVSFTLQAGPPVLVTQPASQTNNAGTTAAFSVSVSGAIPLSYQWRKGALALVDGGNITGARTSTLTITNVTKGNEGNYSVVVTNASGSTTSTVAALTVLDLWITVQPANQTNNFGTTASFGVSANGAIPLYYQWRKDAFVMADGGNITGAQTSTLTVSNVSKSDDGNYTVVVTNASDNATSTGATLTVVDPWITGQPASQSRELGQSVTFSVAAAGAAPLEYQWWKDGVALPQASNAVLVLTNLQWSDAGRYTLVVSNPYGSVTSAVAQLLVDGPVTLDNGFNPTTTAIVLYSLAVQPDGKILVGGHFSMLAGQPRTNIARLNPDGTVDNGFNPGAGADYPDGVRTLAVQADGKVLVGGYFRTLGGQPRTNIARLNADGTVDSAFNPGADYYVSTLALQADGKILVGGSFSMLGGQPRAKIARLNVDGTLDSEFNPGGERGVNSLALQTDGKILVGGEFTMMGGQTRNYLARLNADGSLDNGFNPGAAPQYSSVSSLAVQADGKVLVGGSFTTLAGQPRQSLARVHTDGSLDSAFNPAAGGRVYSLAVQADGRILVGGYFSTLGGQPRAGLARLNDDGSLDSGFTAGVGQYEDVHSLALQADGKILVGGGFTTLNGQPRNFLGRLNNSAPASQSLTYAGSTITWLRGSTSPEIWRAAFEASTNGLTWINLGTATRLPGGWQVTGISLPTSATIHARGFVASSGIGDGVVESVIGPLGILTHPASLTNNAGTSVRFSVSAVGASPISYQWRKGGMELADGGNISGALTPALSLSNVLKPDEGGYSVVVSNASRSVTSTVATLTVADPFITAPPTNQSCQPGQAVTFSVAAGGTGPLNYQWWKDGLILAQATNTALIFTNVQWSDAGSYTLVVSNTFGSVTSTVAVLSVAVPASVDSGFNPGVGGGNPYVFSLAVQSDGKILVGGIFTTLGGQSRTNLARLNADGTLDSDFNPDVDRVYSLAVQADGKVLVGGDFGTLDGQPRMNLARLNAAGTLDSGFNPGAGGSYSSIVNSLALQADGKIVVGGSFTTLGGQPRTNIGRLNLDGTLDTGFNPGAGVAASGVVNSLAVQPDGKILVGGSFTGQGGQVPSNMVRLNADGSLDSGFNPGASGQVSALAIQADGKILVGGGFQTLGGQPRNFLARLNPEGTLDNGFNPGPDSSVLSLAVQADGKVLVGGHFWRLGGQARYYLGRLNADGSLDSGFNPGASHAVNTLAVQADGKILAGGSFAALGGVGRMCIGRLNNTAPATQSLAYDGAAIIWLRGGTGPEVWRTTFEASTNGSSWATLGAGTRIPGGWQLAGVSLPTGTTIRARGYVAGAQAGSGWFVESAMASPALVSQPADRTNNAGTTAIFSASAVGGTPLSYQWRKGLLVLADGGRITGARTPTLTLSNVFKGDEGGYSLVITNASGSATSTVANLTVIDPWLTGQPISQSRQLGESVTFSVTAGGTAPVSYQWCKDGLALTQSGAAVLVLTNLQWSDAGLYAVVVSNAYGSLTSAVAQLWVDGPVTLDSGFNPGAEGREPPIWSLYVKALAVQADGRILVGGDFTTLGGQPRTNLGRLNADGTLDGDFHPRADFSSGPLVVQADGKILMGDYFDWPLGGQSYHYIGRLSGDGTVDHGFSPELEGSFSGVSSLAVQADGKILVIGSFNSLCGQARTNIARLNEDGTLDTGFNPVGSGYVGSLVVQADGKILVGGRFTTLSGQLCTNLARLNTDGTLDSGFHPAADGGSSGVYSLAVQADGKILVGGDGVCRLNGDGSVDTGFSPWGDGYVETLVVQADGRILVGGYFSRLGGQSYTNLARLNTDGTVDSAFNPGASDTVYSLAVQADGKVLVGGAFTTLGGVARSCIGRLTNTAPATQTLACDGSTITWLRGGTGPEVWRTTFEASTNGSAWARLGAGTRILGGWQLSGVSLASGTTIRARGYVAGDQAGSSWFVESMVGRPVFVRQPVSRTNNPGTTVTFSVATGGTGPLSHQWRKGGVVLADGGNITGARTPTLTVSNVFKIDEGGYSLVVSNAAGSATSTVATLTVVDPLITIQPVSLRADKGTGITLSVTAVGTPPLYYQWHKDGATLPQSTEPSLAFTNLQASDAGSYTVEVLNPCGSVTSAVAVLAVTLVPLDREFSPNVDRFVEMLAVQPDGKILVGGYFSTLNGQPRNCMGRLNADGTLDANFDPQLGGASGLIQFMTCLALQADGKILVGGHFTTLRGQPRNYIGRLNPDGTLDTGFNLGADNSVGCIAVEASGRIIVGGWFSTLGGQPCNALGRLNADGSRDATFNLEVGPHEGAVTSLAVQSDGKILVSGGIFNLVFGGFGRLHPDGTLDAGFTPDRSVGGPGFALALQADGKFLKDDFVDKPLPLPSSSGWGVVRLNTNGTFDVATAADQQVFSLAVQADGKILVGGTFTTIGGQAHTGLARLNPDLTVDATFDAAISGNPGIGVFALAVQADGRILVGGGFDSVGGQARGGFARLINTYPATQNLSFTGSQTTWLRGGASPEVWRTSFDTTTNGRDWISLGSGTRIVGGWQLAGLNLSKNAVIRARGFAQGGGEGPPSVLVETIIGPPLTLMNDDALGVISNRFGFHLSGFPGQVIVVEGSTNLRQWLPLQTNTLGSTPLYFSDPGWSQNSKRFYRARQTEQLLP